MDVLTMNMALQKLQVNQSAKDGQLPLPATNYTYISEMTDWISSARQYIFSDDLRDDKPGKLTDVDRSSSGCLCSAVSNDMTSPSSSSSSSSSKSSLYIPPQSDSPPCLSGLQNSDEAKYQVLVSSAVSILEEERRECSQSPTRSNPLSSEEELSGVDWSYHLSRSSVSGTSDEEVSNLMTSANPFALGIVSSDVSHPVAVTCHLEPQTIQPMRMGGLASAKKKVHPISASCDSAAVVLRPNLDFEKMRKTCYGRRQARNDIKKPKFIRIRGFRASVQCTLQSQFSPSTAAFCSLSRKVGFSPVISVESLL